MSDRRYDVVSNREPKDPDYERIVRSMSEEELDAEILAQKGDPGYQLALLAEFDRRAAELVARSYLPKEGA